MNRFLTTLTIACWAHVLMGQTVTITKDPRIDMLLRRQMEVNREADKLSIRNGPGFRVMVVNTNDRSRALEVKSRMMSEFPDHKSYLLYQSPYFKILVGNFRQRKEADELLLRIKKLYPIGSMVVPATIEIRSDKDEPPQGN